MSKGLLISAHSEGVSLVVHRPSQTRAGRLASCATTRCITGGPSCGRDCSAADWLRHCSTGSVLLGQRDGRLEGSSHQPELASGGGTPGPLRHPALVLDRDD